MYKPGLINLFVDRRSCTRKNRIFCTFERSRRLWKIFRCVFLVFRIQLGVDMWFTPPGLIHPSGLIHPPGLYARFYGTSNFSIRFFHDRWEYFCISRYINHENPNALSIIIFFRYFCFDPDIDEATQQPLSCAKDNSIIGTYSNWFKHIYCF
jgi:hypothetical protein